MMPRTARSSTFTATKTSGPSVSALPTGSELTGSVPSPRPAPGRRGSGGRRSVHVLAQSLHRLRDLAVGALQHDLAVAGLLGALGLAVPQVEHLGREGAVLALHAGVEQA